MSDDVKALAGSLSAPYCCVDVRFEATRGRGEGAIKCVAMIPLRQGGGSGPGAGAVFGPLVLDAPNPTQTKLAPSGDDFSGSSGLNVTQDRKAFRGILATTRFGQNRPDP